MSNNDTIKNTRRCGTDLPVYCSKNFFESFCKGCIVVKTMISPYFFCCNIVYKRQYLIIVVSGMNVAFIIFPLAFLFKKAHLKRITSNLMIIAFLFLFLLITGFSPSVTRAAIMAVLVLAAQIIMRDSDVLTCVAISAIILLLYNPFMLFDIGFQLSYAATLSIILFYKSMKEFFTEKHIPGFVSDILAVTISAQIGVVPITAYYFNKISIISIVSNLLVVPIVEVVTVLGFCMAILGRISIYLSQIVGYLNYLLLSFILFVTKVSAQIPFAVIKIITPSIFIILIYYLFVIITYFKKSMDLFKIHYKKCVFILALSLIVVIAAWFIPKGMKVTFIDVGEGDSTLIRTSRGKVVLIDGGGSFSRTDSDSNAGNLIVMPLLLDYNISKIDLVIATHGHDDHIKGLEPILEEFNVGSLMLPESNQENKFKKIINYAKMKKVPVFTCKGGDSINIDGETYMKVLSPNVNHIPQNSPLNNGSLVLKLQYRKISILFVGDIEKEIEDSILSENIYLKSDILKIAHHGSKNSSNTEFIDCVKPSVAVISVGKNNFGHPTREVLARLKEKNVITLRTDLNGAIIVGSDGNTLTVNKFIKEG